MRYTLKDLTTDFPDERAALLWLFEHKYPRLPTCTQCRLPSQFYLLTRRRCFTCVRCHGQTYPLQGTIFAGSTTPLNLWFHAIYMLATNKAGVSAKQLERELGVTYKTAFRMLHQIRTLMVETGPLKGIIEVDETFLHPNPYKRSSAHKTWGNDARRQGTVIFGLAERGGGVRTFQVPSTGARVLLPIIEAHVAKGSEIHTDGYLGYRTLTKRGYVHRTIAHGSGQFHTETSSTQNIENVWGGLKRGIKGVYRHVDAKYASMYAAEYAWRYTHREDESMFWSLMLRL